MTRTLSTLMGSGVQLVDALGLVTEMMGNAVVKQALKDATEEVSRGIPPRSHWQIPGSSHRWSTT